MVTTRSSTANQPTSGSDGIAAIVNLLAQICDNLVVQHGQGARSPSSVTASYLCSNALLHPLAMQQQDRLAACMSQDMARMATTLEVKLAVGRLHIDDQASAQLVNAFRRHVSSALTNVLKVRQSLRGTMGALSPALKPDDIELDESFRALFINWMQEQGNAIIAQVTPKPPASASSSQRHRKLHDHSAVRILEFAFSKCLNPSAAERQRLAELVGLTARQVMIFWQNRRHRRNLINTVIQTHTGGQPNQAGSSSSSNEHGPRQSSAPLNQAGPFDETWNLRNQSWPQSSSSAPGSGRRTGESTNLYGAELPPAFVNSGRRPVSNWDFTFQTPFAPTAPASNMPNMMPHSS